MIDNDRDDRAEEARREAQRRAEEARRRAEEAARRAEEAERAAQAKARAEELSQQMQEAITQQSPELIAEVMAEVEQLPPEAQAVFDQAYAARNDTASDDWRADVAAQFPPGSEERLELGTQLALARGQNPSQLGASMLLGSVDALLRSGASAQPQMCFVDGYTAMAANGGWTAFSGLEDPQALYFEGAPTYRVVPGTTGLAPMGPELPTEPTAALATGPQVYGTLDEQLRAIDEEIAALTQALPGAPDAVRVELQLAIDDLRAERASLLGEIEAAEAATPEAQLAAQLFPNGGEAYEAFIALAQDPTNVELQDAFARAAAVERIGETATTLQTLAALDDPQALLSYVLSHGDAAMEVSELTELIGTAALAQAQLESAQGRILEWSALAGRAPPVLTDAAGVQYQLRDVTLDDLLAHPELMGQMQSSLNQLYAERNPTPSVQTPSGPMPIPVPAPEPMPAAISTGAYTNIAGPPLESLVTELQTRWSLDGDPPVAQAMQLAQGELTRLYEQNPEFRLLDYFAAQSGGQTPSVQDLGRSFLEALGHPAQGAFGVTDTGLIDFQLDLPSNFVMAAGTKVLHDFDANGWTASLSGLPEAELARLDEMALKIQNNDPPYTCDELLPVVGEYIGRIVQQVANPNATASSLLLGFDVAQALQGRVDQALQHEQNMAYLKGALGIVALATAPLLIASGVGAIALAPMLQATLLTTGAVASIGLQAVDTVDYVHSLQFGGANSDLLQLSNVQDPNHLAFAVTTLLNTLGIAADSVQAYRIWTNLGTLNALRAARAVDTSALMRMDTGLLLSLRKLPVDELDTLTAQRVLANFEAFGLTESEARALATALDNMPELLTNFRAAQTAQTQVDEALGAYWNVLGGLRGPDGAALFDVAQFAGMTYQQKLVALDMIRLFPDIPPQAMGAAFEFGVLDMAATVGDGRSGVNNVRHMLGAYEAAVEIETRLRGAPLTQAEKTALWLATIGTDGQGKASINGLAVISEFIAPDGSVFRVGSAQEFVARVRQDTFAEISRLVDGLPMTAQQRTQFLAELQTKLDDVASWRMSKDQLRAWVQGNYPAAESAVFDTGYVNRFLPYMAGTYAHNVTDPVRIYEMCLRAGLTPEEAKLATVKATMHVAGNSFVDSAMPGIPNFSNIRLPDGTLLFDPSNPADARLLAALQDVSEQALRWNRDIELPAELAAQWASWGLPTPPPRGAQAIMQVALTRSPDGTLPAELASWLSAEQQGAVQAAIDAGVLSSATRADNLRNFDPSAMGKWMNIFGGGVPADGTAGHLLRDFQKGMNAYVYETGQLDGFGPIASRLGFYQAPGNAGYRWVMAEEAGQFVVAAGADPLAVRSAADAIRGLNLPGLAGLSDQQVLTSFFNSVVKNGNALDGAAVNRLIALAAGSTNLNVPMAELAAQNPALQALVMLAGSNGLVPDGEEN